MAKKQTEIGPAGCGGAVVILALIWLASQGWFWIAVAVLSACGIAIAIVNSRATRRRAELAATESRRRLAREAAEREEHLRSLCERFGDEIAARIDAGEYWMGATEEQIEESLGYPEHVRQKVYKAKSKKTWCYRELGVNRYALKIHIEDGVVVGWED